MLLTVSFYLGRDSFSVTSSIYKYREENGRTYHGFRDGCK